MFFHFSSFLLPVVQKFRKKWQIAIFLEFFHFFNMFYHVFSFFIIFACSGAKILQKMKNCNFPPVFLKSFFYHCFHHVSPFLLPVVQ